MKINIIKEQIQLAKQKTDRFISEVPEDKWNEIPNVIQTNMNWQLGHIILANYLHGVASISGANEEFKEMLNISDFIRFYGPKSDPNLELENKPSRDELLKVYTFTMTTIFENLDRMVDTDLDKNTAVPNPAVKTKYEALMWLPQHQSWHNGQIALLKRVLE